MMGHKIEKHPFYEPLKNWVADQLDLDASRLDPGVVSVLVTQVQKQHGPIGDFEGVVQLNTSKEQITFEVEVDGSTIELSREEIAQRSMD